MPRDVAAASDCPPDAAFADLLEGRLTEPDATRLERHTAACDSCRALLDALTGAAPDDDAIARALLRTAGHAGGGPQTPGTPAKGRTLDRKYALGRLLGKGGMGEVYEAEHLGTGRRVAVKLIRGRVLELGPEAEGRFRREARAAAGTRSPHIVEVLDSGEDAATGDLYLVMEHLRGEDLQRLVDRVGPLAPDVALRIAAQALAGLGRLHDAGTVHRDVKPANLFLAQGDDGEVTVKLLDFGIAKVTHEPLRAALTAGLTRTEGMLGSPLYMSPEQMTDGKRVDGRADLWSLGSALYCALAGSAPMAHVANVFELLPAIRGSGAPPLRGRAPWVPAAVEAVVHRALAVDVEKRYPSAAAMLEAIRALLPEGAGLREEMLAGVSPEARAARPPVRRSHSSRTWLAVVAVVAVGVVAVVRHARAPAPSGVPGRVASSAEVAVSADLTPPAPLSLPGEGGGDRRAAPSPPLPSREGVRSASAPRAVVTARKPPPIPSASAPPRDPMRAPE